MTNYQQYYKPRKDFHPVSFWHDESDRKERIHTPYGSYYNLEKCDNEKSIQDVKFA